jgi:hypothetical protein
LFFTANLVFHFADFGRAVRKSVVAAPVSFYVASTQIFPTKAEALARATLEKDGGGAAYIVSGANGWSVVKNLSDTQIPDSTSVTTKAAKIKLENNNDEGLVNALVGSFKTTFDTLCEYGRSFEARKISKAEIMGAARLAYNNLVALTEELTRSGGYDVLTDALVRQLFGLNAVWLLGETENFSHVLKYAASWVIFAFFDLTNAA